MSTGSTRSTSNDRKLTLRKKSDQADKEPQTGNGNAERTGRIDGEQKVQYRDFYDSSPVGFQSLDSNGCVIDVNKSWLDLLGYNEDEVLGRWFGDFLAQDQKDIFIRNFPRFKSIGQVAGVEYRMLSKEGEEINVSFDGRVVRDDRGGFKQTHCVLHNITKRKQTEDALQDAMIRYDLVLEGAGGAWDWDVPNKRVHFSSGWKALRGYSDDEIGDSEVEWSSGIHPDDASRVMAAVKDTFEGDSDVFEEEYRVRRKDGSYIWILDRGKVLRNENGRVVRMAGSETDITRRKEAELKLERQKHFLTRAQEIGNIGTWELDLDRQNIICTDETHRVCGIPQDAELTYDAFLGKVHPEDRELFEREWRAAIKGKAFDIQHRLLIDGEVKWVRQQADIVFDDTGKAELAIGVTQDITLFKQAEEIIKNRLENLTRPIEDSGDLTFTNLFDVDEIQKIQDSLAEAFGVSSIITDTTGNPLTRPSSFCRLCNDVVRKTYGGLSDCIRANVRLGKPNPAGPTIQPCLAGGLQAGGTSIVVDGIHVANWLIGQVRNSSIDNEQVVEYARKIGADEDEFRAALLEVPEMPTSQFELVAKTLHLIAGQLSQLAYHNLQQARAIAKRLIAQDELSAANERLEAQRKALEEKNLVLAGVLDQVQENKDLAASRIQANLQGTVLPLLDKLEHCAAEEKNRLVSLLKESLTEVMSPFMKNLQVGKHKLTPREIDVCNMIRRGLSSKEIASILSVSEQTIRGFRKSIRKKLGISAKKINLSTFLSDMSESRS